MHGNACDIGWGDLLSYPGARRSRGLKEMTNEQIAESAGQENAMNTKKLRRTDFLRSLRSMVVKFAASSGRVTWLKRYMSYNERALGPPL